MEMLKRGGAEAPVRIRTLPYMDDYLCFFSSREAALWGRQHLELTLDYLGLSRNPTKGCWEPSQQPLPLGPPRAGNPICFFDITIRAPSQNMSLPSSAVSDAAQTHPPRTRSVAKLNVHRHLQTRQQSAG